MLRHDMFDGVGPVIQKRVDVLHLYGPEILKTLEHIFLISAAHEIYLLRCERRSKRFVVGEAPAVTLRLQGIRQLVHVPFRGTVIAEDFTIEREKDLVEPVRRHLANVAPEEVGLDDKENFQDIFCVQFSLSAKP